MRCLLFPEVCFPAADTSAAAAALAAAISTPALWSRWRYW